MYLTIENERIPVRTAWRNHRNPRVKIPHSQEEYDHLISRGLSMEHIFGHLNVRPYTSVVFVNGWTTDPTTYLAAITPREQLIKVIPMNELSREGKKIARSLRADGLGIASRVDEKEVSHTCIVPVRDDDGSMRQINRPKRYRS